MKVELNQRASLIYDREQRGKIVVAGPQQSEVKFDNGTFRYIPNNQLKVERPRLRPRIK